VKQFDRVVCIILSFELDKAILLMLVSNFVPWEVNMNDRASLQKEFPENFLVYTLV